jgi:hypothetical protein
MQAGLQVPYCCAVNQQQLCIHHMMVYSQRSDHHIVSGAAWHRWQIQEQAAMIAYKRGSNKGLFSMQAGAADAWVDK